MKTFVNNNGSLYTNSEWFIARITAVGENAGGDCDNYPCSWQQESFCDNLSTLDGTALDLISGDYTTGLNIAYPIGSIEPAVDDIVLMRFRGIVDQTYNVFEFIPVSAGTAQDNSCCKVIDVECSDGQLAVTYTDGCITPYSSTTGEPTTTPEPTTSTTTTTPFALDILSSSPLPDGSTTSAYGFTFTAFGGSGTYTNWAVTAGSLPPGLSLNATTGLLDGVPSLDGSYSFWVEVTDTLGATFSKLFELDIVSPTTTTTSTTEAPIVAYGYFAADNDHYQYGNNSTAISNYPIESSAGDVWKSIDTSQNNSIGLQSGKLYAWGDNTRGQLGNGTTFQSGQIPNQVLSGGGNHWTKASCGVFYMAGLASGNNLYTWGGGANGVLGISGSFSNKSFPQFISGNWVTFACGNAHMAAINNLGQLFVWGDNGTGQLSVSGTSNSSYPRETSVGGTTWSQVFCGNNTTIAIKSDGTCWVAGQNDYGQLGLNSTTLSGVQVLTQVYGGGNFISAAGGLDHSLFIKSDNTLWAAGRNNAGQLGDGTILDKTYLVQVISSGKLWNKISAGERFSEAITQSGELYTFGVNTSGECGIGNTSSPQTIPVQTALEGVNWKYVGNKANSKTFVALKDDQGTTTTTTTSTSTTSTTGTTATSTTTPGAETTTPIPE